MTVARAVLVVDDTDAHRYVMTSWLRRSGFTVVEAATGADALRLAGPDVDAVVLDVNLPDMRGTEVLRRLRAAPATAALPVMHVSATAIDARARTAGLEGGADAYLVEPLDRDEFVATVRRLCRLQEQRLQADEHTRRLEQLAAAVLAVHTARGLEELVEVAAAGAADVLRRPVLALAPASADSNVRVLCAGPGEPVLRGRFTSPVDSPARETVVVGPAEVPAQWAELVERAGLAGRSWRLTPSWAAPGRPGAGLAVATLPGENVVPDEAAELADQLAEALATAAANARSYLEEHAIAVTLQNAMLPHALPDTPELRVAARYLASDAQLSVGGDFYDALPLPGGRTALVIGDVQGHSLRAATIMAELRFTLRAYLAEGHEPPEALRLLNTVLIAQHPELVTVCIAVLDPAAGTLEVTNAGHLPPLLVTDDGAAFVRESSPLLGVPQPAPRVRHVQPLPPRGTLVLVTDGLLERSSRHLGDALDAMATTVAEAGPRTPDELCDLLVRTFARPTREDDVAVVAASWGPA
ncbi:SpoIIE family protein phosphatase [Cellulomonas sp. NPDC055163]